MTLKVISFDLDGTLSDSRFDALLWDVEIPRAYAREHGVPFDVASKYVQDEYKRLWGVADGDWRDAGFWLKHFKLSITWEDLLGILAGEIAHFEEVIPVLSRLSKRFRLIIISNAERKFLDAKLRLNNLERFFERAYSVSSDFNLKEKNVEVYGAVMKDLGISPEEWIHVGDDADADVAVPKSLGISALLLSRSGVAVADLQSLLDLEKFVITE